MKTKSGVSPLLADKKDPNSLRFQDKEKADILQHQFCSVFTEEIGETPTMYKRTIRFHQWKVNSHKTSELL